jgi:hypothetical protein
VRALVDDHFGGSGQAVFAKPLGRQKRFTGHVFAGPDDLIHLEGASRSMPIHCAEIVTWLSEYRVFVVGGDIVGIRHYGGDPSIRPDEVISEAVGKLEASDEATASYGTDFGVLAEGRTALVEWKDGFGLGSYGLEHGLYTRIDPRPLVRTDPAASLNRALRSGVSLPRHRTAGTGAIVLGRDATLPGRAVAAQEMATPWVPPAPGVVASQSLVPLGVVKRSLTIGTRRPEPERSPERGERENVPWRRFTSTSARSATSTTARPP